MFTLACPSTVAVRQARARGKSHPNHERPVAVAAVGSAVRQCHELLQPHAHVKACETTRCQLRVECVTWQERLLLSYCTHAGRGGGGRHHNLLPQWNKMQVIAQRPRKRSSSVNGMWRLCAKGLQKAKAAEGTARETPWHGDSML